MCLTIKKGTKRQVATRSMRVFKVLTKDDDGDLESPFRFMPYKRNEMYKAPMRRRNSRKQHSGNNSVDIGLHAYISLKEAMYYGSCLSGRRVVEAFIPKGASFYRGKRGDIVSNKLQTRTLRILARVRTRDLYDCDNWEKAKQKAR